MAGHEKVCAVGNCSSLVGPKGARGWCTRHYQRWLKTGDPTGSTAPTVEQRFFAKLRDHDGCWEWTAVTDDSGYGLFKGEERTIRAHIWSFEFFIGAVPEGLELDHTCHDKTCSLGTECPHRRCANPWHLEPVTDLVNSQRGRGARRLACPADHPYTPENTYINPQGRQVCRQCAADSRARYDAKKEVA